MKLPKDFSPAREVRWAQPCGQPPFINRDVRRTGAKAQGVRYERKVLDILQARFPLEFVASPWFCFGDATGGVRYCQPDGLLFDFQRGIITIFEVKFKHVELAWWQLKHLYLPVLDKAFPRELWGFAYCEIVRWFDPAVSMPEQPFLREDIARLRPNEFAVYILRA